MASYNPYGSYSYGGTRPYAPIRQGGGDSSVPSMGPTGGPSLSNAITGSQPGISAGFTGVQGPVVGTAQNISDVLSSPITTGLGMAATMAGIPGIGLAAGLGNIAAQHSLAPPGTFTFMDALQSGFGMQPVSNTLAQIATDPVGNFQGEEPSYDPNSLTYSSAPNPAAVTVSELGAPDLSGEHGDTAGSVGGDAKMICGELYRQGYMSMGVYMADQQFGAKLAIIDPDAQFGYRLWARPMVSRMRKSKKFTRFVALFAMPWARHIAGKKNWVGAAYLRLGVPACRAIGWITRKISRRDCPADAQTR